MAVETFHTLIARNKRNSFLLILGFMVFFVGLGLLITPGFTDGRGTRALARLPRVGQENA